MPLLRAIHRLEQRQVKWGALKTKLRYMSINVMDGVRHLCDRELCQFIKQLIKAVAFLQRCRKTGENCILLANCIQLELIARVSPDT